MEDATADVQQAAINHETAQMLSNAIDQLDSEYRDLIYLKYYYNMRNIDIAHIMNMKPNLVNGRIFSAKNKLRKILGEEGSGRLKL